MEERMNKLTWIEEKKAGEELEKKVRENMSYSSRNRKTKGVKHAK